jgi:sec-independent protein translocase protein TatA
LPFISGVGPLELVIILVIVIIIFGVGKLPTVGGALGKSIREFREQARPDGEEDEDGEGSADVMASSSTDGDGEETKSSTASSEKSA